MIPSQRSRDISEWTTPSAFQLDPHFTDDAPDFQLRDTHYYTAGNHFILHHLDYYILHHNRLKMRNYIASQMQFWETIDKMFDVLSMKIDHFTRFLPDENTLGISNILHLSDLK